MVRAQRIPSRPLDLITNQPTAQSNHCPRNKKNDQDRGQNAETVACDFCAILSVVADVKERVWVESFCVVGYVCHAEVEE
jgi:hypothetical protein